MRINYIRTFLSQVKVLSPLALISSGLLLSACQQGGQSSGFELKFLVGSDLAQFCEKAAIVFNQTAPKTPSGEKFFLSCQALGSGDVVNTLLSLAQNAQQGSINFESAEFPTLISVDGEIYQNQLIYQMNQRFPGKNYIPQITDSPLLAYSPMVLMTSADLAPGLEKLDNPFASLAEAKSHDELDPKATALPISYVHTAPTRSNSGLQTLVAQFSATAGKRPENLTIEDVKQYQGQVQKIQEKITRYGKSTASLANSMVKNGPFWASVASVYESLVIDANRQAQPSQTQYQAVYPKATFSSNMRAILPNAPWVSDEEKAAAQMVIEYLRSPQTQQIAADLGLRPGIPGIALGKSFSPQSGVIENPTYDSLRPPKAEVVDAMLKSWQTYAKKASQVAVVIDTSGSMSGEKLTAVQNTLFSYINNLGPKETIALMSFSNKINPPIIIEGNPVGKKKGLEFIKQLKAGGGTRLYDSALFARDWLSKNLRPNAINAVLVLTDGNDSGSQIKLDQLSQELEKSGYASDERISFFTIGYGRKGDFNLDALKKIAEVNGGYYRQGDPSTILTVMSDLQVEF